MDFDEPCQKKSKSATAKGKRICARLSVCTNRRVQQQASRNDLVRRFIYLTFFSSFGYFKMCVEPVRISQHIIKYILPL